MKQNETKTEDMKITDNFASKGMHKIMNDPDVINEPVEKPQTNNPNNKPFTVGSSDPAQK